VIGRADRPEIRDQVRQLDELAAAARAARPARQLLAVGVVPAELDAHAVARVLGQVAEALPVPEHLHALLRAVPAAEPGRGHTPRPAVARLLEECEAHRHARGAGHLLHAAVEDGLVALDRALRHLDARGKRRSRGARRERGGCESGYEKKHSAHAS
jgi:hypothetical protein